MILFGSKALEQFASISKPISTSDDWLISLSVSSRYSYLAFFSGIAKSSASTLSSSCENPFSIFTHLFFTLAAAAQTFNPSTATDVLATSPFNVLIVHYVDAASIPIVSTILFMTNVPWLQLASKAFVLITLLEFSWTNLTGTTLILDNLYSLMHMLNLHESLIHSGFLTFLQHSAFLTFIESYLFSKPVHAVLLDYCHYTPYKLFCRCKFLHYAFLRIFNSTHTMDIQFLPFGLSA